MMHAPITRPKTESNAANRRRKFEKWLSAEQRYRNILHHIDGVDAGARVAEKIGTNKSYQWLLEVAVPGPVDRPHPANFDGAKLYWSRWDHARRCVGDLRWDGKATCKPDFAIYYGPWPGQTVHGPRDLEFLPWREPTAKAWSNIYWKKRDGYLRVAERVSLSELLSTRATADSNKRDKAKPKRRPMARLDRQQEAELFAGMSGLRALPCDTAVLWCRNRIIESHMWLVKRIASKHRGQAEFGELVNEGMFGLCTAIDAFDYTKGHRFQTFAWRQVDRSIRDYLRKQRQLRRHQSTDAMAAKGRPLGFYEQNSVRQKDEYKFISDAWGKNL